MRNATSQTVTEKEAKSQINLAIADLRVAKEKSPQNSYIYYNLGCIYLNQKTYNPALEAFNKAIEYDSRLPEAYYNRGLIYLHQNDKNKAFADFSKAGQLGLYKAYALMKKIGHKQ